MHFQSLIIFMPVSLQTLVIHLARRAQGFASQLRKLSPAGKSYNYI